MVAVKDRPYKSSDLKELMDNIGGWARNWDDAIWYVRNVAGYDADFARDEIEPLAADLENVRQKDVPFETDYRKLYRAITGTACRDCPPPEGVRSHGINPREMAERWLKGLDFPHGKEEIVAQAKKNKAPDRVVEILNKIQDEKYESMGHLLESVGDETWDHD